MLSSGKRVTALKVAPDGVRCAMLVSGGGGTQLMVAAIVRSGAQSSIGPALPISAQNGNFTALTWYDADHVIALSHSSGGPVLDEIAMNGETLVPVTAEAGTVSIAADGPCQSAGRRLVQRPDEHAREPRQPVERRRGYRRDPVYPG